MNSTYALQGDLSMTPLSTLGVQTTMGYFLLLSHQIILGTWFAKGLLMHFIMFFLPLPSPPSPLPNPSRYYGKTYTAFFTPHNTGTHTFLAAGNDNVAVYFTASSNISQMWREGGWKEGVWREGFCGGRDFREGVWREGF